MHDFAANVRKVSKKKSLSESAHIHLFSIFIKRVVKYSRIRSNETATYEVYVYNTSWTNVIKRLWMRILHIHEHARSLWKNEILPNEFYGKR